MICWRIRGNDSICAKSSQCDMEGTPKAAEQLTEGGLHSNKRRFISVIDK